MHEPTTVPLPPDCFHLSLCDSRQQIEEWSPQSTYCNEQEEEQEEVDTSTTMDSIHGMKHNYRRFRIDTRRIQEPQTLVLQYMYEPRSKVLPLVRSHV